MKKILYVVSVFAIAALIAPETFAQSSGSFNYSSYPMRAY